MRVAEKQIRNVNGKALEPAANSQNITPRSNSQQPASHGGSNKNQFVIFNINGNDATFGQPTKQYFIG